MSTLPVPGTDSGTWGGVLNTWLGASHSAYGMPLKVVLTGQTFPATGYTIADPASANNVTQGIASGNCPFTYPPAGVGKEFWLLHQSPSSIAYTPSFPSNVFWMGNTIPVFSGPGFIDVVHNVSYDGTNWFADLTPGFAFYPLFAAVGSLAVALPSATSIWTLSVTPANLGDIFAVQVFNYSSTYATGISGGGVTTWHHIGPSGLASNLQTDLYWGVITATGSQTITVTMNVSASGGMYAQEFSRTLGTWAPDVSVTTHAGTSSPWSMPALTGTAIYPELYIAAIFIGGNSTLPSVPSGYITEPSGLNALGFYNLAVSGTQVLTLTASGITYGAGCAAILS